MIKLAKELSFLICILFFIACGNPGNKSNKDSDNKLSIQNEKKVDSIYIKFEPNVNHILDILSIKSNQINVKPDSNFSAYYFDQYSSLVYFPTPTELIYPIKPGDSLIISSKNKYPYIKVLNNNTFSERELNFVAELSFKGINIFEYFLNRKGSAKEVYESTLNYTDNLLQKGEIKKSYANWLKKEAYYSFLKLTQTKGIDTDPVDLKEKINIDSNLSIHYYQSLLWKHMANLLGKDYTMERIIVVADSNFTGSSKDYVLYNFSREYLSSINSDQAKTSLTKLKDKFKDKEYLTLLETKYSATFDADMNIVDQLLMPDGTTISFDQMLSKYKGKKVYLDVWASWCSPCRAEFPNSRMLKKSSVASNVVFVYISTDKVQNDWLKANKEEELGVSDSYLLTNPSKSNFMKKYEINAIPRYFIFAENGSIISPNAPRPGSEEIKNLLKL